MDTSFHFNELIRTPNGNARFIGYMKGREDTAQVSRWVSVKDLSLQVCERIRPSVKDMSRDDFNIWRGSAHINVNEIVPVDTLAKIPS